MKHANAPLLRASPQTPFDREMHTKARQAELLRCALIVFAAWLAAHYLLPRTVWGNTSPFAIITGKPAIASRFASVQGGILLLCIALGTSYLYRDSALSGPSSRVVLWVLTGVYLVLIAVQGLAWHGDKDVALSSGTIIMALLCGLLTARLCSYGSTAVRLLCFLGSVQALYALYYIKYGPGGTFGDPATLYLLMLVSLPVSIIAGLSSSKTVSLCFWNLCSVVLLAALIASGNIAGLAVAFLSVAYLIYHLVKRGRRPLVCGLVLAALVANIILWQPPVPPHISFDRMSTHIRLWKQGIQHVTGNFWSGGGIGSIDAPLSGNDAQGVNAPGSAHLPEPGNTLIHWMMELGIAGGIFFCLFVFHIGNIFRRQDPHKSLDIATSWIAFFGACLLDTPFGTSGRACGTVIFGMLLGATLLPTQKAAQDVSIVTTQKAKAQRLWWTPEIVFAAVMFGMAAFLFGLVLRSAGNRQMNISGKILTAWKSQQILKDRSNFMGDPRSPYTLVEFGDYECPPCRARRYMVQKVLDQYRGKVKLDFRNLPLPALHSHAMYAAIVAEAARRQGTFWSVHNTLFSLKLDDPAIEDVIRRSLSNGTLSKGMMKEARDAVEADMDLAVHCQLQGTPSFLLCTPDGKVYQLSSPEDVKDIM